MSIIGLELVRWRDNVQMTGIFLELCLSRVFPNAAASVITPVSNKHWIVEELLEEVL